MRIINNKIGNKGVLTAEAAIVLPLFLFFILGVSFLVRVVYVHEMVRHALYQTCTELCEISYVYSKSGLISLEQSLESASNLVSAESSTVITDNSNNRISQLTRAAEMLAQIVSSNNDVEAEFVSEVMKRLESAANQKVFSSFIDFKQGAFIFLTESIMKKNLSCSGMDDAHDKLSKAGVEGGLKGLNFSESEFLKQGTEEITLIVTYSIKMPFPGLFPNHLFVSQKACARAWMQGDYDLGNGQSNVEDIWALGNFDRGIKLRKIFGANLPYDFPVISSFKQGTATMIKSLDITAEEYSQMHEIKSTVEEYIEELASYKGQEEPWYKENIVIKESAISDRVLVLIIPENQISEEKLQVLSNCSLKASSCGVILKIERYAVKAD